MKPFIAQDIIPGSPFADWAELVGHVAEERDDALAEVKKLRAALEQIADGDLSAQRDLLASAVCAAISRPAIPAGECPICGEMEPCEADQPAITLAAGMFAGVEDPFDPEGGPACRRSRQPVADAWQALTDDLHTEFDQGHVTVAIVLDRHRGAIERAIRAGDRPWLREAIRGVRNPHRQGDLHNYGWNEREGSRER